MSNHEQSHESKNRSYETSKDKSKGKKAIIAAVAAGVLVVGVGGALLANNINSGIGQETKQSQNQTQEETAEQREARQKAEDEKLLKSEKSFDERVADAELPPNLNDKEFDSAFSNVLTKWMNEGASDLLFAKLRSGISLGDIALDNANVYAAALFGKDWGDKTKTDEGKLNSEFYVKMQYMNYLTLEAYKKSIDDSSDVPYKSWIKIAQTEHMDKIGSLRILYYTYEDNSSESGVSADLEEKAQTFVGYSTVDNTTRISEINALHNQQW